VTFTDNAPFAPVITLDANFPVTPTTKSGLPPPVPVIVPFTLNANRLFTMFESLFVITIFPVATPAAAVSNPTMNVSDAPGAKLLASGSISTYPAGNSGALNVNVAPPAFVTVNIFDGLTTAPRAADPKSITVL
jgi:hypothetical protein